tara:strand:- start:1405 stop:2625 length:1221 start_codon:yes stop_codon:yes gene_type:complete
MKNSYFNFTIFFLFFISTCTSTFGQITFEKGYFIDNSGRQTDCLIKNLDWKNNPTSFHYKISEQGEISVKDITEVEVFNIINGAKYIRKTVEINRSSDKTSELDEKRKVEFNQEQLFLKELVTGPANLYYYEDGSLIRFFYSLNDNKPSQLVYKKYRKENFEIAENNEYRQQLNNALNCTEVKQTKIKNLKYKIDSLKNLFNAYNGCINPNYLIISNSKSKLKLNTYLKIGLANSSLTTKKNGSITAEVKNILNPSIGLELESILSHNKGKWAFIVEPTFQISKEKGETYQNLFARSILIEVNYKSFEIPIGIRHYFFLNKKSKLFLDIMAILDIPINSYIEYSNNSTRSFGTNFGFFLDVGYNFNEKLSLGMRYFSPREVFGNVNSVDFTSKYAGVGLTLGYKVF